MIMSNCCCAQCVTCSIQWPGNLKTELYRNRTLNQKHISTQKTQVHNFTCLLLNIFNSAFSAIVMKLQTLCWSAAHFDIPSFYCHNSCCWSLLKLTIVYFVALASLWRPVIDEKFAVLYYVVKLKWRSTLFGLMWSQHYPTPVNSALHNAPVSAFLCILTSIVLSY